MCIFSGTYRIERHRETVNQIPWMGRCCGFFGDISGYDIMIDSTFWFNLTITGFQTRGEKAA